MAGIKVSQHKIFKIDTNFLKLNNWNVEINEDDAMKQGYLVSLFDSQFFRIIKNILKEKNIDFKEIIDNKTGIVKDNIDWTKYVCSIVFSNKKDFETACKGLVINNQTFVRYCGTTGGLKKNSVIFVNEKIYNELEQRTTSVDKINKLVPAKYEAYKALTLSSSQEIYQPKKILIVEDCYTEYIDTVLNLDDSNSKEPIKEILSNIKLENNATDGFNLCSYEYIKKVSESLGLDYITSGICLRNKWLKGMLYPFPIKEFADEFNNGEYEIKDIWGEIQRLDEVDMIITESSLKLWSSYDSVDSYLKNCKESGYKFSVTKIIQEKLEDERDLNYQYLQSYDFSDKDIEILCKDTIDYLKGSMGGDYEKTLEFLGVKEELPKEDGWIKALALNKNMLNDSYVIDCIHRLIKKKINDAKIGKLKCNGNFQIFSNDPFVFMENVCKIEPKGILTKNECYSSYWVDKDVSEILAFRSPMSCHNNIRKLKVINSDKCKKWYRYMKNILIVNSFDSFCKAENGEDGDGDANYSTNNSILLNKFINLPAIQCVQKTAEKKNITKKEIELSNKKAFGNDVGSITNYVTSMKEVQSHFDKDSKEYKELDYRIACGQLYQQNSLDSIKGIVSKPMPKYWYNKKACEKDPFNLSICADKKPYFMIYRYKNEKKKYNEYLNDNNLKCIQLFGITLEELLKKNEIDMTDNQLQFVKWYYIKMPVGLGRCAMNKICYHIEKNMNGYKVNLESSANFYDNFLKGIVDNVNVHTDKREELQELLNEYVSRISSHKSNYSENAGDDKDEAQIKRDQLKKWARDKAKEICKRDEERLKIIIEMCYGNNKNKQFCWDTVGDLICHKLEGMNNV